MSDALLLLVPIVIAAGAFAQAVSGMGFSLIAAPALLLALGPHDGVAVCVLLAALSSIVPLAQERRRVRPRAVASLLLPTLLCTPLVAWLLRDADTTWLALGSGVAVVIGVLLLGLGLRSAWFARPEAAALTGSSSALLNVVGGVGGPPIGLYVANAGWTAAETRANLHAFFLTQNLVTALALGLRLPSWPQLAALAAGTALGLALAHRLSAGTVRRVVLAVSLLGGIGLIGGALA
ncbi:TSUP family transporter [Nocardioides dubius]|uniref:Probable membrane transporter protein n=1 Tax=Nocardioides dubius TaxID=317019 RepID=A0ABP4E7I6_9ACTN